MPWDWLQRGIWIAGGCMLLYLSILDIRSRQVPVLLPVILGCVSGVLRGPHMMMETLAGALPGMILLGISFLCRGQIGVGDGLITAFTGLMVGWKAGIEIILISFFLVFIFSLSGMILRRLSRKTVLPFIPFYCGAYMGVVVVCWK